MSKRFQQYPKLATFSLMVCTMITGCASQSSSTKKDPELIAAKEQITKIEEKMVELETRLGALNEKFNLLNSDTHSKSDTVKVQAPAAQNATIPTPAKPHHKFADSFHHDEATDRYREAKILFETKKYPDAILEMTDFVKNNPRHLLASNAQFYIGLSYLQQKEYKIAEEELTRVLVDHPHSNAVPDALAALAKTTEAQGKTAKSNYYKEKLDSFFANSPQAHSVKTESSLPNPSESAPTTAPALVPELKEKPAAPQPPTAPLHELNSAETNGEQPGVVK